MRQASILVVDRAKELEVLRGWLELASHHVYTARSGTEALAILSAHTVDILVSEFLMPGMDGLTLLKKAKMMQSSLHTILITDHSDRDRAIEALAGGAAAYLLRPIRQNELVIHVDRCLEKVEQDRALDDVHVTSQQKIRALQEQKSWLKLQRSVEGILDSERDTCDCGQVEMALQASENRYRSLVENMSSGVAVYEVLNDGEDFIFKSLNLAGQQLSKVKSRDVVGRRVSEVFPGIKEFGLFSVFQQVHKTGQKKYHPVSLYKDDRLNMWFENFVYRLPSGEIVAIYDDLTQSKVIEAELMRSESMFRGLLDAFLDPLLLFTRDRKVLWGNESAAEFMAVDDPRALIGKQCIELCGDDKAFLDKRMNDCFVTGQPGLVRITIARKALDVRTFPILQRATNQVSHVILTAMDVCEQVNLQAQSMRAARLVTLGVLAASVAHEVSNPNNVILFNAPIVEEVWREIAPILWQNPPQKGEVDFGALSYQETLNQVPVLLRDITACSRRIQRIVTQLKFLVRTGDEDSKEPVDMVTIVHDAVALLHNKIQQSTSRLQVDLGRDLPKAMGNAQQFEQIVVNLILNALESLPDKSHGVTVILRVGQEKDCLLLIVKDEGCGMDDVTVGRILEPLFTTRSEVGGTGLGLAVSKEIIDRYRGKIRFESEVGKGTSAIVELPIA